MPETPPNDEPTIIESTPAGDAGEVAPELPKTQAEFFERAAQKVRSKFPTTPGVYLFQDSAGRVIYVGKAKNLRAGPAATSSAPRPRTSGPGTWCARRTTSTSSTPTARWTPC